MIEQCGVASVEAPAAARESGELTCEVHTSFDSLRSLQREWDELVASAGGDIYLSLDWCRVWWEHYGRGRSLHVMLFRRDGKLVGVAPIFTERVWLGPVWVRMAKIVGSDFSLNISTPAVTEADAPEVMDRLVAEVTGRLGCDAACLGPMSGDVPWLGALREACARAGHGMRLGRDSVYTSFALPETFDAYVASLDKRQRGNVRRDLNQLQKQFEVKVDVVRAPTQVREEYERFRPMHTAQWVAEGKLGHFGDWPGSVEFNAAMIEAQSPLDRVRFVRLMLDGKVAGYQYAYAFGDCYYWRLPARLAGAEWDRFGMGRVGLVQMIEAAIGEGIRRVEGGEGHYPYKLHLGAVERPLQSFVIVNGRTGSQVRFSMFERLARLLHLVYYRGWFLKVAPKLPLKRGSLWRCWIRSRL